MGNKRKDILITVLKIFIAGGLLFILFRRTDFEQIINIIRESNAALLIISLSSFFLAFGLFMSLRLFLLTKEHFTNFLLCFKLSFIGLFFNNFLPTNIGGDGYKMYYLKKHVNKKWSKPFIIILIDRVSGSLMNILIFMGYFIFHPNILNLNRLDVMNNLQINQQKFYLLISILGVILTGIILFLIYKNKNRLFTRIKKFLHECIYAVKEISLKKFLIINLISLFFHVFRGIGFYFLVIYFQGDIFFLDIIFLLFLTTFLGLIPITVGALGTLEGAIILSLVFFDVPTESAKGVAILYRTMLILFSALGAILFSNLKHKYADFKIDQ